MTHAIRQATPMEVALQELSDALSRDIAPPDLAVLFERVKEAEAVVEHLHKMVRDRVIQTVAKKEHRAHGYTYKLQAGDYLFEVRQNQKVDAKKLEGLLRSKGLNPAQYMRTEITYKVKEEGMDLLLKEGHLSLEELEALRPSDSYTVMSPKRTE